MTCRENFEMDHPGKDPLDYCPHQFGYTKRPPVVKDKEVGVRVCNPNHSCIDCWNRDASADIEKKDLPVKPIKATVRINMKED